VSGPSGAGKSSIVASVLARTDVRFSVSATTRSARPGEVDGVDYLFVSKGSFEEMRGSGEILEWAEYGSNLYGTPASEVLPLIATGHDVLLDIENEGAKQIRTSHPQALMIFIRPPSLEELENRLVGRGDTTDEDMAKRLSVAEAQILEAPGLYDHIIVNDDLAGAISQVLDILTKPVTEP
jgi:guanylate kinase